MHAVSVIFDLRGSSSKAAKWPLTISYGFDCITTAGIPIWHILDWLCTSSPADKKYGSTWSMN